MFHFPGCPPTRLWIHLVVTGHYPGRVPPFGNLRINAYLRLPSAYRSLSRPSSAISALASTLSACSRDLASSRCPFPPKTIERNEQLLIVCVRFFPVQFSRCVEVSTFSVDPSKRYRKRHLVFSQIPSLTRWPTIIFGIFCLCRSFRLPATVLNSSFLLST